MKKVLLPIFIFIALLVTSCQPAGTLVAPVQTQPAAANPTAAVEEPAETVLTVTSLDGKSIDFTLDELKELPSVEGQAGIKSSTGKITPPALFKGVLLTELLDRAGGADSTMGIEIEAKDGYAMTFSADQVAKGDFIAYDPGTGDETQSAGALQVLIAYEIEGKPLDIERDGVLRLVVVSEKNNQVTDGHWSIKWVRKITVKQLAQEWELALDGGIVDTLDRGSFESCSTGKCHPAEWTDNKAQTWSGTPLWLIAGRMDDEIKHGDDSFNEQLADQGYTVEVVGKDGYSVTFDIERLVNNDGILLAHQVNGNPLNEEDFPLRLVGSDVGKKEGVSGIVKIILHFDPQTAAPTATLAPTPESTGPITLPEGKAVMINGLVEAELAWSMDELRGMDVVQLTVEHPKKGKQDAEGVRLNALLDLAKIKPEAKQITFTATDGFTASAELTAIRDCQDCLVAFDESGALKLVMPGMESSFWVKDLIAITVQ